MKTHQNSIGKSNEWLTPIEIIKSLGVFDLDPCTCREAWENGYYDGSIRDSFYENGLTCKWSKEDRIWLNPPFNRYERPEWMAKMADHGNGIMLVPAACETDAFYRYVWPYASGIMFIKGRPHFYYKNGRRAKANSGCTICLVSYGKTNYVAMKQSQLGICLPIPTP